MAVMIHPFGPKPHALALIDPVSCTGCGIWIIFYLLIQMIGFI